MEESSTHECNSTAVESDPKQSLSRSSPKHEEPSTTRSQTSVMSEECGISTSDRPMIEQPCKVEEIPSRSGSVKDLPNVTIEGSSLPNRIKIGGQNSPEKTTAGSIQKNEVSITHSAPVAKPQHSGIVQNKQQGTSITNEPVTQSVLQSRPVKSEPVGITSNNNSATGSSNQTTTTNVSTPTQEATPIMTATASSTSQSIPATASTTVTSANLKQTPSSKPEGTVVSAPAKQHPIQQTVSTTSQTTSTSTAAASVSQAQTASSGSSSTSNTIPAVRLSTPPSHPAAPIATAVSTTSTASNTIPTVPLNTPPSHPAAPTATAVSTTSHPAPPPTANAPTTTVTQLPAASAAVHPPPSPPPPLKATTMLHLQKKYTTELQYMLREFRKLERQLLGAKGNGSGIEESAGSRERREKLHSFILHLEDTIRQIDLGCKLESEGKSTVNVGVSNSNASGNAPGATPTPVVAPQPSEEEIQKKQHLADSAALTKLTKEKEEEENVQKLEEHILANLLPVKVRLTKQLAAQQGASRNPAGMPAARRGMLQPAAEKGKGTFAAAAEQRRKQAEAARVAQQEQSMLATPSSAAAAPTTAQAGKGTQFGKPLGSGGSSLTQKLHGSTLGSKKRPHGHGVGSPSPAVPTGATSTAVSTAVETTTATSETPSSTHKRKILYAGIAPGSEQIQSSVSAAAGVHGDMVMETTPTATLAVAAAGVRQSSSETPVAVVKQTPDVAASSFSQQIGTPVAKSEAPKQKAMSTVKYATARTPKPTVDLPPTVKIKAATEVTTSSAAATTAMAVDNTKKNGKRRLEEMNLTEEERKKLKRRRRRKKRRRDARRMDMERQRQIVMQQQAAQASQGSAAKQSHQAVASVGVAGATAATTKKTGKVSATNKLNGKKKGPRAVEYICALCSETYSSTCDYNPWWGLTSHECPKCRKSQIPRIDITAPANAIEYHPALLAHAEDSSGGNTGGGAGAINAGGGMSVMHISPSHMAPNFPINSGLPNGKYPKSGSDSDSGSDLSDDSDGGLSDDSYDSEDSDSELQSMTPAEQAENEKFGREYTGPKMTDSECSRLLALMCHASTCPGRHKNPKHRDICHSTKFLMLHVRDCPGTTSSLDVCPFPWCRKVKHLLYHLVSCTSPSQCTICSPKDMTPNFAGLMGLNEHRRKKQRERMKAALAAASAAKAKAVPPKVPTATMHTVKSRAMHQLKTTAANALKPPQQIKRPVPPTSAISVVAPVVKSEARLGTIAHTSTTVAIQQPVATSQPKLAVAVTSTSIPAVPSTAPPAAGAAHSSSPPVQTVPKASPAAPQALPTTIVQSHVKLETRPVSALTNTTAVNAVAATSSTRPQVPEPVVAAMQPKAEVPLPLGTVTCTQTAVSVSTVAQTSQPQQQVALPSNIITNVKAESPPVANIAVQAMNSTTDQVTVNSTSTGLAVPNAAPAAASSANIATRAVSDVPIPSSIASGEIPNTTNIATSSSTSVSVPTPTVQSMEPSLNLQTAHPDFTDAIEANPPLSPARIDSEELPPPPVSDSGTLTSHSSPSLSAVQCETKPAATKPVLVPTVNTTTEKKAKESTLTRTATSSAALIEDSEGCCGHSEAENDADCRCSGHTLPNGSADATTVKTNSIIQASTNTGGVLVGGLTSATSENGEKNGTEPFDNRRTTEGERQNTTSTAQPTDNKTSCSEQVVKKEEPVRISC